MSERIEVVMPQMGVSVAEGTLTKWCVEVGQEIEADDVICEISTDKIDVDVPSPATGVVAELVAEEDETYSVGELLAVIERQSASAPPEPDDQPTEAAADGAEEMDSAPAQSGRAAEQAAESGEIDRSRFVSPVVQRMLHDHNLSAEQIKGTGTGGRVTKKDVLSYLEDKEPPAERRPAPVLHSDSPYQPEPESRPGRREAMDPIRQAIAKHMTESRKTSAHVTTVIEVDFTAVQRRRQELADQGIKLTYLSFIAEAAIKALQQFPILNASIKGDEIIYHDDINLGIAVDLNPGLIVPVIDKAQNLSACGLGERIEDLARRARERKLTPDEVQGGTFTITNPGQFGTLLATPIINQPQVAILDVEKITKRPVVLEGDSGDVIAIRPMGLLPLSFDHRALDGATAARFLARLKEELE